MNESILKGQDGALASVFSGLEHHPIHRKMVLPFLVRTHTQVAGLMPHQGIYGGKMIGGGGRRSRMKSEHW